MELEVTRCPYCGEEILAVAKKCRHCGEWLDTAHIRQRGETTSGYQSGRFDGIQVTNVAGPPNVSTPLPSRNKKRWPFLIGLGGGIILIIIGFFVYHFLGCNKMPSVEGKWTVEMDSTGSFDDTIKIWDLKNYTCIKTLKGHTGHVYSLNQLPDGKLISGASDWSLIAWDLEKGEQVFTLEGHEECVNSIDVFPDGKILTSSTDQTVKLWD